MVKATFSVLSERDKQLVLETEPRALRKLDEDGLLALHARVRRARTKHATNYRRAASSQVGKDRARALASKKNRRDAARAEVFEEALARVSRRLAVAARATADELREERLTLAGTARRKPKAKAKPAKKKAAPKKASPKKASSKKASPKTTKVTPKAKAKAKRTSPNDRPDAKKTQASTKAKGKRRQAKRDAR